MSEYRQKVIIEIKSFFDETLPVCSSLITQMGTDCADSAFRNAHSFREATVRVPRFVLQHDEGPNCGNLGSTGGKGRFLMFPQATDEIRENNDRFSPCSVEHISKVLHQKKDNCFVGKEQKKRSGVNLRVQICADVSVTLFIYPIK